jgi:hypothetical protein
MFSDFDFWFYIWVVLGIFAGIVCARHFFRR